MTTESDRTGEQAPEPVPAAPVTEANVDATPVPPAAEELPAAGGGGPAPYADTTDPGRPAD